MRRKSSSKLCLEEESELMKSLERISTLRMMTINQVHLTMDQVSIMILAMVEDLLMTIIITDMMMKETKIKRWILIPKSKISL